MLRSARVLSMPYGAWEMKACYQRNLLLGNLTVLVLLAFALTVPRLVATLVAQPDAVMTAPPKDEPIIGRGWVRPPPPIERTRTDVSPTPPNQSQRLTDNLSLVADSLWDDSRPDQMLPTQDELSNAIGTGDGTGPVVVDTSDLTVGEYLPSDTEFVFTEKYPEMIQSSEPEYPFIARQTGMTGTVHLKVLVDKEGRVREAKVVRSSGYAVLDEAALAAAYKNVFSPGIQNGYPVACWVGYKVAFKQPQ